MKAVVGERGQITIPKAIREQLGVTPGTVLELHEEGGRVIAEKATPRDPVSRVRGCLELDTPTDKIIARLRDGA